MIKYLIALLITLALASCSGGSTRLGTINDGADGLNETNAPEGYYIVSSEDTNSDGLTDRWYYAQEGSTKPMYYLDDYGVKHNL